jgi:hypothetical protein
VLIADPALLFEQPHKWRLGENIEKGYATRAYVNWNEDEDEYLLTAFCNGQTIEEIAENLQRDEGGVSTRIKQHDKGVFIYSDTPRRLSRGWVSKHKP